MVVAKQHYFTFYATTQNIEKENNKSRNYSSIKRTNVTQSDIKKKKKSF